MKLLKTNILNGKTEKIDSYDAFDEVTINNYEVLQGLGINDFDEFVDAFKKDKELEIAYDSFIITNVPEKIKKTDEEFILECQGKAIDQYLDQLIVTAKDVVRNLEDYKRKISDQSYTKHSDKERILQWTMNMLQQINWRFDDGADVATKYAVAKINKEFAEKQG